MIVLFLSSTADIRGLFRFFDPDSSGVIDYEEFLDALVGGNRNYRSVCN